jgi:hypothetical protein
MEKMSKMPHKRGKVNLPFPIRRNIVRSYVSRAHYYIIGLCVSFQKQGESEKICALDEYFPEKAWEFRKLKVFLHLSLCEKQKYIHINNLNSLTFYVVM